MKSIEEAFDEMASRFDGQRKYIIPSIEEFYQAAVWAACFHGDTPSILDIGAGTGLLSELVLKRYPHAHMTLIDISESMLNIARERFSGHNNITYITADYSRLDSFGRHDLIVSALSIHHLTHDDKKILYQKIYHVAFVI